jgi:site-specific recombinase XerD
MMTLREALTADVDANRFNALALRSALIQECPRIISALHLVDAEYTAHGRSRGYNLVKREHKKLGFVYYVRYWHAGKMLPSKWCTHTNDYEQARAFAAREREELVSGYLRNNDCRMIRFFKRFFDTGSETYRNECLRNGEMSESRRHRYQSVMVNKFIPFLRQRKIKGAEAISAAILDDFQETLLSRGMKPQSVNDDIIAVRKAFTYLTRKGLIRENPCLNLQDIPERMKDRGTHGCYEIGKIRGVFDKRWSDKHSYLLNLIIYTTDMRNSEIKSFSKEDIIELGDCHFISLKKSKTGNGIRLVPLHDFVYRKVMSYAQGKAAEAPVFGDLSDYRFSKAYKALAGMLKVSADFLKAKNITYYSGRHFWKTLMNAEGLGEDVEEVFMGHKVSGDVAKLYNHRDMHGRRLIVKKAKEVFRILDRKVFTHRTG